MAEKEKSIPKEWQKDPTKAKCPYGCNIDGQYLTGKGVLTNCPYHYEEIEKKRLLGGSSAGLKEVKKYLRIPLKYREKYKEIKEIYKVEGIQYISPQTIQEQKEYLETTLSRVGIDGEYPTQSAYLYGSMVDLLPWVYALQSMGLRRGLTTVPLVTLGELSGMEALMGENTYGMKDTVDIQRIENKLAQIGAQIYIETGVSYGDYLTAELCVIMDEGLESKRLLKQLKGLVVTRGLRGLTTIVVGLEYRDREEMRGLFEGEETQRFRKLRPYQLTPQEASCQELPKEEKEAEGKYQLF